MGSHLLRQTDGVMLCPCNLLGLLQKQGCWGQGAWLLGRRAWLLGRGRGCFYPPPPSAFLPSYSRVDQLL